MKSLPAFQLFPDPIREKVFEKSDGLCVACSNSTGWIYIGPKFGKMDDPKICPWCIENGAAGKLGVVFNDSVQYPSVPETPQLPPEECDLVEHRTPGFTTWQGNHWLGCCGKACLYLGEADSSDLLGRWAAAVPSMFEGEDRPQSEIDEIVRDVSIGRGPCAYVFQCRVCSALRAYWDCH